MVFSLGFLERTSPDAGAGGWYRREGDVVWDVHSEVYIETTERTRVYKTEEKTPTSKAKPHFPFPVPCLSLSSLLVTSPDWIFKYSNFF